MTPPPLIPRLPIIIIPSGPNSCQLPSLYYCLYSFSFPALQSFPFALSRDCSRYVPALAPAPHEHKAARSFEWHWDTLSLERASLQAYFLKHITRHHQLRFVHSPCWPMASSSAQSRHWWTLEQPPLPFYNGFYIMGRWSCGLTSPRDLRVGHRNITKCLDGGLT